MTTTSTDRSPGWGDAAAFGQGRGIPLLRLVKVELRKMVDTRAGRWLMAAIGVLTIAALTIFHFAASAQDQTFRNAMLAAATPQGILLPVLGILLITQEWGQRTGMVTFALVPQRATVLWAKVIAAVLLGLAVVSVAMGLAALAAAIGGAPAPWAQVGAATIGQYVLLEVLGVLGGLIFGLLFLNTAAAIVVSFALPIGFTILSSLWSRMHEIQPWTDPATAQSPLQAGAPLTGTEWQHLATTTLIWVVLPFAIGMWRVLRAELK